MSSLMSPSLIRTPSLTLSLRLTQIDSSLRAFLQLARHRGQMRGTWQATREGDERLTPLEVGLRLDRISLAAIKYFDSIARL
jgi:hypothetical protein